MAKMGAHGTPARRSRGTSRCRTARGRREALSRQRRHEVVALRGDDARAGAPVPRGKVVLVREGGVGAREARERRVLAGIVRRGGRRPPGRWRPNRRRRGRHRAPRAGREGSISTLVRAPDGVVAGWPCTAVTVRYAGTCTRVRSVAVGSLMGLGCRTPCGKQQGASLRLQGGQGGQDLVGGGRVRQQHGPHASWRQVGDRGRGGALKTCFYSS